MLIKLTLRSLGSPFAPFSSAMRKQVILSSSSQLSTTLFALWGFFVFEIAYYFVCSSQLPLNCLLICVLIVMGDLVLAALNTLQRFPRKNVILNHEQMTTNIRLGQTWMYKKAHKLTVQWTRKLISSSFKQLNQIEQTIA